MSEHHDEHLHNRITAVLRLNGHAQDFEDLEALLDGIDAAPLTDAEVDRVMGRLIKLRSETNSDQRSIVVAMNTSTQQTNADSKLTTPGADGSGWNPNRRGQLTMIVVASVLVALGIFGYRQSEQSPTRLGPANSLTKLVPVDSSESQVTTSDWIESWKPVDVQIGETVQTTEHEQRQIVMPDGSKLALNQQTQIEVQANRRVKLLRGEVFAEVNSEPATGSGTPFVVETPERLVTALGTKFAVQVPVANATRRDQSGRVVVTQGRVRVDSVANVHDKTERSPTVIHSGEQLALATLKSEPAARASHTVGWTRDLMTTPDSLIVPKSPHAGGSVQVVNPNGQEANLSLRRFHIDVHIEDGFARTTIDQTYFNHTWQRLEGTFRFPLPADASLSRLAMYVNGKLMEGGMVERNYGRNVFEQIMHTRRDPALLEWLDGSTFQMRVFPLEPRQEKRIVLSYSQRLTTDYGKTSYRFPAGHNLESVGEWSAEIRVKQCAPEAQWQSSSHAWKESREGQDLVLRDFERNAWLDRDVVLEIEGNGSKGTQDAVRFSEFAQEGFRYLMVRYRPTLLATVKEAARQTTGTESSRLRRPARQWIFLVENSADRDRVLAKTQQLIVSTLLEHVEHDDSFNVIRAGTKPELFRKQAVSCTSKNVVAALKFLKSKEPVGALDLEAALDAAVSTSKGRENSVLVHVGSGIAVLGENDHHTLLRKLKPTTNGSSSTQTPTYLGIAVGKRWSKSFMQAAAEQSRGLVTQINPDEPVAWRAFETLSTFNAPRLVDVSIDCELPGVTFLPFERQIADGQEIAAVTRLPAGSPLPQRVTVKGSLIDSSSKSAVAPVVRSDSVGVQSPANDRAEFDLPLPLSNVASEASYLPRTWARLEIDRLVGLGAVEHKNAIIDLSKAMYVMSPFTSLLVLEDEAMYEQFKVDRGRKDHWALYPAPAEIKVVTDNTPAPNESLESLQQRAQEQVGKWKSAREQLTNAVRSGSTKSQRTDRASESSTSNMETSKGEPQRAVSLIELRKFARQVRIESSELRRVLDQLRTARQSQSDSVQALRASVLSRTMWPDWIAPHPVTSYWADLGIIDGEAAGADFRRTHWKFTAPRSEYLWSRPESLWFDVNDFVIPTDTSRLMHGPYVPAPRGGVMARPGPMVDGPGPGNLPRLATVDPIVPLMILTDSSAPGLPHSFERLRSDASIDSLHDVSLTLKGIESDVDAVEGLIRQITVLGEDGPQTQVQGLLEGRPGSPLPQRLGDFYLANNSNTLDDLTEFDGSVPLTTRVVSPFGFGSQAFNRQRFSEVNTWAFDFDSNGNGILDSNGDGFHPYGRWLPGTGGDVAASQFVLGTADPIVGAGSMPADAWITQPIDLNDGRWGKLTSVAGDIVGDDYYQPRWLWPAVVGWRPNTTFYGEPALGRRDLSSYDHRLRTKVSVKFDNRPLSEVVKALVELAGQSASFDNNAIIAAGGNNPMSFSATNTSIRDCLRQVLEPRGLDVWLLPHAIHVVNMSDAISHRLRAANQLRLVVDYAPGLQTSDADRAAVLEAEGPDSLKPRRGTVSDAARKLIEQARSHGWEQVRVPREFSPRPGTPGRGAGGEGPTQTLHIDGAGRFQLDRTLPSGLREQLRCDGTHWWSLYPEIALGAKRSVNRFHRAALSELVPWFVPPVEDLSLGANVTLVTDRVVRVTPVGCDSIATLKQQPGDFKSRWNRNLQSAHQPDIQLELEFDTQARLVEKRWLVRQKPDAQWELSRRIVINIDGRVRVLDGQGRELTAVQYERQAVSDPQFRVESDELVVLPLPYRSGSHNRVAITRNGQGQADYSSFNHEQVHTLLASYFAERNANELTILIKERCLPTGKNPLPTKGEALLGYAVLLSSLQQSVVASEITSRFPDAPLARYLEHGETPLLSGDLHREFVPAKAASPFVKRLCATHNLTMNWASGRYMHNRPTADELIAQINRDWEQIKHTVGCDSIATVHQALRLLIVIADAIDRQPVDPRVWAHLANCALDLETNALLKPYVREVRLRWLARAQQLPLPVVQEHLKEAFERSSLVPLNAELRSAVIEAAGTEAWANAVKAALDQREKNHRVLRVEAAFRCFHLSDIPLAWELFLPAIAGQDLDADRWLLHKAFEFYRLTSDFKAAESLIPRLLQRADGRASTTAADWQVASEVASAVGDNNESLRRLERCYELEFAQLPDKVNLQAFEARYVSLFDRYDGVAADLIARHPKDVDEFAQRVRQAALRWMSIASDDSTAGNRAGRVMWNLRRYDEAWEFWTSTVAQAPDQSNPWQTLAQRVSEYRHDNVIDFAWHRAFACEPTNPDLLEAHSNFAAKHGRRELERELLQQIVNGQWQPRFAPTVQRAKDRLK